MKIKGLKALILTLLISICACGFVFYDKPQIEVHAVDTYECFYLMGEGGEPYLSNTAVGTIDGIGEYVLGDPAVELNAVANTNFQFVGWLVIYEEQSNKTVFITEDDLDANNQVVLKDKDNEEILATIEIVYSNSYAERSKFLLDNVFEDIVIRPVFDHIYYQVKVNEIREVSPLTNRVEISSGNILYYETASTTGTNTTYSNSYIEIGGNNYYYGNVEFDGTKYYKIHKTLETAEKNEKVEISRGAFRVGEEVQIGYNVNIVSDPNKSTVENVQASTNIDLREVAIVAANKTVLNRLDEVNTTNCFDFTQDRFSRTSDYLIKFNVRTSSQFVNEVDLTYHNLYLADINVVLDGNKNHSELDEILGTKDKSRENQIISNISIYNFYSTIDESELMFFAKESKNNGSQAFGIGCVDNVSKTIGDETYIYYKFVSLNGGGIKSQYYSNLNDDVEIVIEYSSNEFKINFESVEYVSIGSGYELKEFNGNTLTTVSVTRKKGDITFNADSVASVINVGYRFVGFVPASGGSITTSYTYTIDEETPIGTKILLCYEKVEYNIVLANYNKIEIDSMYSIKSITFGVTTNNAQVLETLTQTELGVADTASLNNKLKLGSKISFGAELNNGFEVPKYSLKDPTQTLSEEDYLTSFTLNQEMIEEYGYSNSVIIYVYEDFISYTLTYLTNKVFDSKLEEDVIMANIDVETSSTVDIAKYELNTNDEYVEISDVNGNLTATVAKIVVSGLKYNDYITLKSSGINVEGYSEYIYISSAQWEDEFDKLYLKDGEHYIPNTSIAYDEQKTYYTYGLLYTYEFIYFTEDGKSNWEGSPERTNYLEQVKKDRTIVVVYSLPETKVVFSIDEDFTSNSEFAYSINLQQSGVMLLPEAGAGNLFVVKVETPVTITISNIAFGYDFIGYQILGSGNIIRAEDTFEYTATSGVNRIVLKFQRINYRFYFAQYGQNYDGEYVKFESLDYKELNIDDSTVSFEKPHIVETEGGNTVKTPLGYYVATVKFGDYDGLSSTLSENNNYRENADILNYTFSLTREQFVDLAVNHSTLNGTIGEIYVDINYLIFTYSINIEYGLTNPKGDSRDDYVVFPTVVLEYNFDGEDYSFRKTYSNKLVTFTDIPYGVDATIRILGGAPAGLTYAGWRYQDGEIVLNQDYNNASNYLAVGKVVQDKYFAYKLTYNSYSVSIVYDGFKGSPVVSVNNVNVSIGEIEITAYDKFEIQTNPIRANGYKFKQVSYLAPKYVEYIYNDQEWASVWSSLYLKEDRFYIANTSETYNSEQTYYTLEQITNIYNESDIFLDELFEISDYIVNGTRVTFTVEYDLLKLNLSHTITESGKKSTWKLTGRGSSSARVEFNIGELAIIDVVAKSPSGDRNIGVNDYVTTQDAVTLTVRINQEALNAIDGKQYDLSKGLTLNAVHIAGTRVGFTGTNGVYVVEFGVGEFMPHTGENIEITYKLRIEEKKVNATTIVKNSEIFYKNATMTIDAYVYGFETGAIVSRNNASEVSHSLQFMSKVNTFVTLTNGYEKTFVVSGVKIYCDDVVISPEKYEEFGIEILEGWVVSSRLMYNLNVEFKVQPIITYKGSSNFTKTFNYKIDYDQDGNETAIVADGQTLSVGSNDSFDIKVGDVLVDLIKVKYISTAANSVETDAATICGTYKVLISFVNDATYDWLSEVSINDNVTLTIEPRKIELTYDESSVQKVSKDYDGTSDWNVERLYSYLRFKDGIKVLDYDFNKILELTDNDLTIVNAKGYISSEGKDKQATSADENKHYNYYIYNFALKEADFNKNFELITTDLVVKNYIQIKKRKIDLSGVGVYNKVYDGTDFAELISVETIGIVNKILNDDLTIDPEQLVVKFSNYSIGTNKTVRVDASKALAGASKDNYYVGEISIEGLTIYPYSLTAFVPGYGDVSILNKRGLTEKDKVDLISLNATLSVEAILIDSMEYQSIYGTISKNIKGGNEYVVGYRIVMIIGGEKAEIDKNLYLSIPYVKDLTGVYFLTGAQTGAVNYSTEGKQIIVDLMQVNVDVDSFYLTQRRILLKPWQIVLIVVASVLVVSAAVLSFILIRKRKMKDYSVHDKI